eukprot:scaffold675933_cov43-Prasinocladus_malaysianus.AAC.1
MFWNNVAAVMYAGAEGHDRALLDKAQVEQRLQQQESQLTTANERVAELEEQIASHQCLAAPQ